MGKRTDISVASHILAHRHFFSVKEFSLRWCRILRRQIRTLHHYLFIGGIPKPSRHPSCLLFVVHGRGLFLPTPIPPPSFPRCSLQHMCPSGTFIGLSLLPSKDFQAILVPAFNLRLGNPKNILCEDTSSSSLLPPLTPQQKRASPFSLRLPDLLPFH